MTWTLNPDTNSDELYELLRTNKKQFIGMYSIDKNIPKEKVFETISDSLIKSSQNPDTVKLALMKGNQMKGIAMVNESKWDTEILGMKYGKMKMLHFRPETTLETRSYLLENFVRRLEDEGFKLVVIRVPFEDISTLNAVEEEGGRVIDVLLTYQRDTNNLIPPHAKINGVSIAKAGKNDEEGVVKITQNVFKMDHFHSDPRLPSHKGDELYTKWVENCLHGLADAVLVAKKDSSVVGFITCKLEHLTPEHNYGVIDLIGVTNESKGKGIGTALVAYALKWFSKRVSSVYVGTQTGNIQALRLYEKLAFKATYAEATLHLWLPQQRHKEKGSRKS